MFFLEESLRGVVAGMLDCEIVVSKFEPQSRNNIQFRIQYIWECYEICLTPPSQQSVK